MCGRKRTGKWIICEACREKHRAYSKALTPEARMLVTNKYRRRCRRQGICYGCGRYVGFGRYKRCEACREKDRLAHAERYEEIAVGGRKE